MFLLPSLTPHLTSTYLSPSLFLSLPLFLPPYHSVSPSFTLSLPPPISQLSLSHTHCLYPPTPPSHPIHIHLHLPSSLNLSIPIPPIQPLYLPHSIFCLSLSLSHPNNSYLPPSLSHLPTLPIRISLYTSPSLPCCQS